MDHRDFDRANRELARALTVAGERNDTDANIEIVPVEMPAPGFRCFALNGQGPILPLPWAWRRDNVYVTVSLSSRPSTLINAITPERCPSRCILSTLIFAFWWRTSILTSSAVHLIKRQRVLLRNRRGLSNRPLQPHWAQHGGPILPTCPRPRHRCLRHGGRR